MSIYSIDLRLRISNNKLSNLSNFLENCGIIDIIICEWKIYSKGRNTAEVDGVWRRQGRTAEVDGI